MSKVMSSRFAVMWVFLCLIVSVVGVADARPPSHSNWQQTFSDEFNGQLDRSIWKDRHPGQVSPDFDRGARNANGVPIVRPVVSSSNAFTQNGNLVLRISEVARNVYNVGYLRTREASNYTFAQKYGYYEARMKLATSPGTWGAFWLMPNPGSAVLNVDDSGRDGAEIDIVEGFGSDYVNHAVHFDDYSYAPNGTHQSAGFTTDITTTDWHVYGLEWTPTELIWYIDDVVVQRLNRNTNLPITDLFVTEPSGRATQIRNTSKTGEDLIPQVPAYMKLTAHVISGTWHGTIDPAELPLDTLVDYVRVYRNSGANVNASTQVASTGSNSIEAETTTLDNRLKIVYDNSASGGQAVTTRVGSQLGNMTTRVTTQSGAAPVTLTVFDGPGAELVKLFRNGVLHEQWTMTRNTNRFETVTTTVDPFFQTSGTTLLVKPFNGAIVDRIDIGSAAQSAPAPSTPKPATPSAQTPAASAATVEAEATTLDSRLKVVYDNSASGGRAVTTRVGQPLGNMSTRVTTQNGAAPVTLTVFDGPGAELVKLFRNGVLHEQWIMTRNTNRFETITTTVDPFFQTSGTTLLVKPFNGAIVDKIDIGSAAQSASASSGSNPPTPSAQTPAISTTTVEAESMTLDNRLIRQSHGSASGGRRVVVAPGFPLGTASTRYNGPEGSVNVNLTLTDEIGPDIVKFYHNGTLIATWNLVANTGQPTARSNRLYLKPGDEISLKLFGRVTFDKITFTPVN